MNSTSFHTVNTVARPTTPPNKRLAIAWIAHSRRSQLLADKLQMQLHLIHSLKRFYWLAPLRYVLQGLKTLWILWREKPEVVLVQNPPIFAALTVYLYAKMFKARYLIDAHTGALLAPWWRWSLPLHGFLSRRAVTTMVTNDHLADLVASWGANAFILADIPSHFPPGTSYPVAGRFQVAVVNSFSPDEPLPEIIAAASQLPDVHFYITGDPLRADKTLLRKAPSNVHFTGFINDDAYIGLMRTVHAIMVLTTDDHTMQRGACEAVAVGKPIITSDWPILRSSFHKGTIHIDNSISAIKDAVLVMQRDCKHLKQEILCLQHEKIEEWNEKYKLLIKMLTSN
jgi:glycosyltransferase involved in cell wall biosynthesis